MSTWLLHAPQRTGDAAQWQWQATGAAGAYAGTLESFAEALAADGAAAGARRIVVLLPADGALVATVNAPAKQQRQLQTALPFLLEEMLASDVERLHVIAGRRIDAQRLQLVAVDREAFSALLATLASAGIDPDVVTVDALLLPPDVIAFCLAGPHSRLLTADGNALAFDAADAGAVIAALPAALSGDAVLLPSGEADITAARGAEAELAVASPDLKVHVDESPRSLLARIADGSLGVDPLRVANLRQGPWARAGQGGFALGFDWRPLAWLAASFAVLWLGHQLAVGITYQRAAEAAREAQVALYRQIFPGSNNVPSPRKQMEGMIGGARGNGDSGAFVPLVAQTAEVLQSLGGVEAGFSPRSLAFDNTMHTLRMDVQARNVADFDRLREALVARGLQVDIGAGVAQDGGYRARINVTGGG